MTGLRHLAQPASALAVAMGVGRFVYTPILPLMTGQAGLTAEAGASVATANYVGYFAGSVAGTLIQCVGDSYDVEDRCKAEVEDTVIESGSSRASKIRNPLSGPNGHSRRK
jgi:hypothetical protein